MLYELQATAIKRIFKTRLPSNLRRDHPWMRAFSYACSLPVTWQRRHLHHSILSAVPGNPCCTQKARLQFDRTRVIADRSFTLRDRNFRPFWLLSLNLTRWLSSTDLTRSRWRYGACANELLTSLLSKSHCLTRHTRLKYTTPLRGCQPGAQVRNYMCKVGDHGECLIHTERQNLSRQWMF